MKELFHPTTSVCACDVHRTVGDPQMNTHTVSDGSQFVCVCVCVCVYGGHALCVCVCVVVEIIILLDIITISRLLYSLVIMQNKASKAA